VRPGHQQNRRRGRHNGGGGNHHHNNQNGHRKPQNPLARSYESNGPDVKVRGTPAHIAEKYMSLARDALSSGDPVLAESYLQHAEHYNRIIMAYREQMQLQGGDPGAHQPQRFRAPNAPFDPLDPDEFAAEEGSPPGDEPQPTDEGLAAHAAAPANGETQPPLGDRPAGPDRPQQAPQYGGDQQARFDRQDRYDRQGGYDSRGDRFDRGPRQDRPYDGNQDRQNRYNDRPYQDRQFQDRNRPNGDYRQRDRYNDRFDRGDRPYDPNRPQRFDRNNDRYGDRQPQNDRGQWDRNDRGDRVDRGPQPPHERHVPDRRPPVVADQPSVEWQTPVPQVMDPPPLVMAPAAEPPAVVAAPADTGPAAEAPPRPTRAPRGRKPAAAPPASAAGERFNEEDQPSFLRRPTRRPKAEPKPDDGTPSGE
jgi:hypothetical protein